MNSDENNENICLVCDLVFNEHELLEHIQNVHEGENQNKPKEIESLEDGKSKFLDLLSNFKSQEDAFNLLYWIKCNNTDIFLTTNQDTAGKKINKKSIPKNS